MSMWTFFIDKLKVFILIAFVMRSMGALANGFFPYGQVTYNPGLNCHLGINNTWICGSPNVVQHPNVMYPQGYYHTQPSVPPAPSPVTYYSPVPANSNVVPNSMVTMNSSNMQQRVNPEAKQAMYRDIIRSPHGSYVLQWQAANSREALEQLRNSNSELENTVIAEYYRMNKRWFVLLEGPFRDRNQAIQVLKSSPRNSLAGDLFPWTRSVDSIRQLDMKLTGYASNNYAQPGYKNPNYRSPNYGNSNYRNPSHLGSNNRKDLVNNTNNNRWNNTGRYEQVTGYEQPAGSNSDLFEQSIKYVSSENTMLEHFSDAYPVNKNRRVDARGSSRQEQEYISVVRPEYQNDQSQQRPSYDKMSDLRVPNAQSYNNSDDYVRVKRDYSHDLLEYGTGYVIQWQAANIEEPLKRIQARYPELGETHIIHYKKHDRDWFVLVSTPFSDRSQANNFLTGSTIASISTRLYPRVKKLMKFQKLLSDMRQLQNNKNQYKGHDSEVLGRSGDYTIQWYATNHPNMIYEMKQRFPELSSAVTVRLRRNDRDWYVLVQGEYENNRDALLALRSPKLRKVAQQLRPWTRSIDSIKNLEYRDS